jgi:molybdopterin converting factor small subunit
MPIRARIPGALTVYTQGRSQIDLEAQTVDQALSALEQRFPALVPLLRGKSGALRPRVNIYLNDEHVRFRQGLETPLQDGDTLYVVPIAIGG